MKKYIKGTSLFLCTALFFSLSAQVSNANELGIEEQETFEFTRDTDFPTQTNNISFQDEYLSPEEYEAVLVEIRQKSEAEITTELKEKVKEIRNEIENSEEFNESSTISPYATYDSISLESMLDRHDGLSLADISAIGGVHATYARNEAKDYTDTTTAMKKDAFRHMTWNFRAAKALGDHKTRIGTINHEWSYLILPEVLKFERETFNSLFKKYQGLLTNTEITNMAKTEADAYAIKYRDNLIASSKKSLAVFNSTIKDNSYIMDFWNNKIGRDYASSNPSSSTHSVFVTAWNANKLINNEGSAATSKRTSLHSTNWWYIR